MRNFVGFVKEIWVFRPMHLKEENEVEEDENEVEEKDENFFSFKF